MFEHLNNFTTNYIYNSIYLSGLLSFIGAYFIGSLSSAIIVCKVMHLPDPRENGSGNPGATNVLRIGGKRAAIITLCGDVLKGVLPVLIIKTISTSPTTASLAMLGAFLGHLYPLFFNFQGGKGVATAIGAIIALYFPLGLCLIGAWFVIAIAFRYSSLAALTAAGVTPIFAILLDHKAYLPALFVMILFLFWRHRGNIARLYHGDESKIKF